MANSKIDNLGIEDVSADKLTAGTIPDARFPAVLPAVSGANLTNITTYADSLPTISSISPSVIENTSTAVTITGTNYVSIPFVDAINASSGAIVTADSVSFTMICVISNYVGDMQWQSMLTSHGSWIMD